MNRRTTRECADHYDDMFQQRLRKSYTRTAVLTAPFAVLFFFFFFLFLLLVPLSLHGQSFIPGGQTTLTLTPASPQAEQEFEARVEAYAYDLARAHITWSINGIINKDYEGERVITLRAPGLGVPLTIAIKVTEAGGATHTATKTITPSALDLVIESDTRVPHFYRGRALPSAGSAVRLIALPSLYTSRGTVVNPATLLYTWQVNQQVTKVGLGQNTLTTTMPRSGSLLVEITAETMDGSVRYDRVGEIAAVEPHNLFYEDNPLHGLSQNTLPSAFTLIQDEISIRAEPYFVSPDIFNSAVYEWTIGGVPVTNLNTDPQTLTLRKTGGKGVAEVAFSIRNLSSLLQAASSVFTVYFE